LYARLKADGVDAWLDKENIIAGQDWELEIRKAVRESDIVIVCLSKQFSQKGYRQNEVRIALDEASLQQMKGEVKSAKKIEYRWMEVREKATAP
jgi:hypothetical protein